MCLRLCSNSLDARALFLLWHSGDKRIPDAPVRPYKYIEAKHDLQTQAERANFSKAKWVMAQLLPHLQKDGVPVDHRTLSAKDTQYLTDVYQNAFDSWIPTAYPGGDVPARAASVSYSTLYDKCHPRDAAKAAANKEKAKQKRAAARAARQGANDEEEDED